MPNHRTRQIINGNVESRRVCGQPDRMPIDGIERRLIRSAAAAQPAASARANWSDELYHSTRSDQCGNAVERDQHPLHPRLYRPVMARQGCSASAAVQVASSLLAKTACSRDRWRGSYRVRLPETCLSGIGPSHAARVARAAASLSAVKRSANDGWPCPSKLTIIATETCSAGKLRKSDAKPKMPPPCSTVAWPAKCLSSIPKP